MPVNLMLKHNDELENFYKEILDNGIVDGILLTKNTMSGRQLQVLITESRNVADTETFSDIIPVQGGRLAKSLSFTPSNKRIAVVCKPCEIKAIVELTKFLQVKKERLFIIGVDCLGTYEMNSDKELRKACSMCNLPAVDLHTADAVLGFIGMPEGEIFLSYPDNSLLGELKIGTPFADPSNREAAVEKLRSEKEEERTRQIELFRSDTGTLEKLKEMFAPCIRCHNCMVACPICYCRECVFRSPTFEHSSESIVGWAERKGAMRMPEDTLLFHLTRLNHMVSSCIACGLCSSACPNDIDVATLFISCADNVQNMLDYTAGLDYDEPAPVTTFKEDELAEESGT